MKSIASIVLVWIFSCASIAPALAQFPHWTKITSQKNPDFEIATPYFINPNVGFIFYRTSTPRLQRTTDGGVTWTYLAQFDTLNCHLWQLYFVSLTHGYAAATTIPVWNNTNVIGGGLYETTDAGDHWYLLSPTDLSFQSVYATDSLIAGTATEAHDWKHEPVPSQLFFTRDHGATWDSLEARIPQGATWTPKVQAKDSNQMYLFFGEVVGNKDQSLSCIASWNSYSFVLRKFADTTVLLYSNDGGANWNTRGFAQGGELPYVTLFSFPHRFDLISQFTPPIDQTNDTYSFLHSVDQFAHLDSSLMHTETGANIAGNSCVQYVSSANDQSPGEGLLRSEDAGRSWTFVPGPDFDELDDHDFPNISVVGNGAVVYAVSNVDGDLYKSTDGGDGTLRETTFAPRFVLSHLPFADGSDTLTAYVCDTTRATLLSQNIGCTFGNLIEYGLTGLPSSDYSLNVLGTHLATENLPDTLTLVLMPSAVGTLGLTIQVKYLTDEFDTVESTLPLVLAVVPGSSAQLTAYQKPERIMGGAGDTIAIPLYCNGGVVGSGSTGSTSITLSYELNTNVVTPFEFKVALAGLTASNLNATQSQATVQLNSKLILGFSDETLIGWLRCVVTLSDSLSTNVTLSDVSTSTVQSHCSSVAQHFDTVRVTLVPTCGDSTLRNYLEGQLPIDIVSVTPNPATKDLSVRLRNPYHQTLAFVLYDALGTIRKSGIVSSESTTIDVRDLPNGSYYLRAASPEEAATTRRIIVAR